MPCAACPIEAASVKAAIRPTTLTTIKSPAGIAASWKGVSHQRTGPALGFQLLDLLELARALLVQLLAESLSLTQHGNSSTRPNRSTIGRPTDTRGAPLTNTASSDRASVFGLPLTVGCSRGCGTLDGTLLVQKASSSLDVLESDRRVTQTDCSRHFALVILPKN